MENVRSAIEKTKKLFAERPTGFWSRNLIDGSAGLQSELEWTHYYAWLANPLLYKETNKYTPYTETPVFTLPNELELVTYENGPQESIIHIKAGECDEKEAEDEKVAS